MNRFWFAAGAQYLSPFEKAVGLWMAKSALTFVDLI